MEVQSTLRKRNITLQYDPNNLRNSISEAQTLLGLTHKAKLRRLPHVFSRVLELPFRSGVDVSVEESSDFFRFIAETSGISDQVKAHTIEIHPGIIKIVVRDSESLEFTLDELELDMWRFRLPETTRPELASAVFANGELIVTIPKRNEEENNEASGGNVWEKGNGGFRGDMGRQPVLVQ